MRLAICSTLILGLAALAACDNAPIGAGTVNRPTVAAPADAGADVGPGGGPVNASKADATVDVTTRADAATSDAADAAPASIDAPDAGDDLLGPAHDATDAADAGAADRAPIPSCAALAAAGEASQLDTFQWMYEVGPVNSQYDRPYDTVTLSHACQLTYQKTVLPRPVPPAPGSTTRTATLKVVDCAAARAWATNARFLDVLTMGDGCPDGTGNPDDAFEVDLTDGTMDRRKIYPCPEPTLDAVRACVSALVARSFP
jgi:hypothetical protein